MIWFADFYYSEILYVALTFARHVEEVLNKIKDFLPEN